jgi:hypothetical protein
LRGVAVELRKGVHYEEDGFERGLLDCASSFSAFLIGTAVPKPDRHAELACRILVEEFHRDCISSQTS